MHSLHTHKQTHTPQMLYLFVGVFKLISLSPGENINCLPGVKVDDKGKGGGGKERKVRKTERKKLWTGWSITGSLSMFKRHVLTWLFCSVPLCICRCLWECIKTAWQISIDGEWQCLLRDITFVRVCARTGLHPLMVCLQVWAVSTTSLTDSGNTV